MNATDRYPKQISRITKVLIQQSQRTQRLVSTMLIVLAVCGVLVGILWMSNAKVIRAVKALREHAVGLDMELEQIKRQLREMQMNAQETPDGYEERSYDDEVPDEGDARRRRVVRARLPTLVSYSPSEMANDSD